MERLRPLLPGVDWNRTFHVEPALFDRLLDLVKDLYGELLPPGASQWGASLWEASCEGTPCKAAACKEPPFGSVVPGGGVLVPGTLVPGGGAMNTVRILSQLGHCTGFIGGLGGSGGLGRCGGLSSSGKLSKPGELSWPGEDLSAEAFRKELAEFGIADYTRSFPHASCGRSLVIKGEGGDLLLFSPGAAGELISIAEEPTDLEEHGAGLEEHGAGRKEQGYGCDAHCAGRKGLPSSLSTLSPELIYLEGFILPRQSLMRQIFSLQDSSRATLAVDLGAAPLVAANRDFILQELLPRTAFLFGTQEEFSALGADPRETAALLGSSTLGAAVGGEATAGREPADGGGGDRGGEAKAGGAGCCGVVKRGPLGSQLLFGGELIDVPAAPVPGGEALVDSLGAGDAYAAFFLSRLLRGSSFEEAAQAAARGSSLTLSRFGGKIDSADFRCWGA